MKVRPISLQLALIETDTPPSVIYASDLNSVAWSYSRREALESCARRYYFDYYGGSKRAASSEPAKDELRILKAVTNRHLRTGEILHDNIASYLRGYQHGSAPDVDQLIGRARQQFNADRAFSIDCAESRTASRTLKQSPAILQEYLYRRPEADTLCDEAETKLTTALHEFCTNPQYLVFHVGAATSGALIERWVNFRPDGVPCRVMGKIDLAYGGFESATLVDWKLGEEDGRGNNSLQLATYALWAVNHYSCDVSALRICKVHLGSGVAADFSVDASILAAARARITQDAIRMAAVHRYGEDGIGDAFTPRAQRGICRSCSYLRVCPAGRNAVNA